MIDWNNPLVLPAPRKANPNVREKFYKVECPKCHTVRHLRKHDAQKAEARGSVCRTCQSREAARLGFEVTATRYGRDFMIAVIQKREAEQPSKPEAAIRRLLDELGIAYQHSVRFDTPQRTYIVDIVLANGTAIEVNGYWHQQRGAERDNALAAVWPHPVVFITREIDIKRERDVWETYLRSLVQ